MRLADPRRRLATALVLLCVAFSLFAGRLVQLQGVDAASYAQAATSERLRTVAVPAVRGSILAADGQPLAATVDAVRLVADQTVVENPAAAALVLAPILGRDEARLQELLTGSDRYVVVAREVSAAAWRHIRELGMPGFYGEPTPQRVYPNGPLAANLLGFLAQQQGKITAMGGLEERYNRTLAGRPGEVVYEKALGGGRIPQGESSRTDPVAGADLRLTLDRDVQWYLEQLLAARNAEVEADSASAMVVEVETGRVLAMATVPTYDPRVPTREKTDVENRTVIEAYEPGSVQKPITFAALLDAGAVTPQTVLVVPDAIERDKRIIHDFSPHETYRLTMAGVLAKSSNVGTLRATERLPKQDLYRYLEKFGYGSRPGLGLPAESAGVLPPADQWTDLDRDTISFGQTLAVSLPQITGAYQAIANGGVRVPLRLVDAVVDADGTEHPLPADEPVRVVSEVVAAQVTTMMEAVTQEGGTASNIAVPGYRIAGKTGTAQKYDKDCGCYRGYTASFMGFAPADDPKVVVTVSFQNPSKTRYGGSTAGPVWTAITGYTLQQLGVVPSGTPAPQVRLTAG